MCSGTGVFRLHFFCGIGAGSKRGILFKGGVAIEALKNIKAVVMDKTGTITKGNFDVQKVLTQDEWSEEAVLSMAATVKVHRYIRSQSAL